MQKQGKINYLIFLMLSMLLSSCRENSQAEILNQARNIINDKPEDAMILLESIPNPETMDEENYMLYILTKTDAKIRSKQDITSDTLIFKAQEYFNAKSDPHKAALANFSAGKVSYDRLNDDKALESYLLAEYYARKTNDDLMIAKSLHCIGNLYYIQEIKDTALVRYKEAYKYYTKTEGSEKYRLLSYQQIGRTYDDMTNLDSALVYFEKGSVLSMQLNDSDYETTFTFLKGMVLWEKGDYGKSEEYLYKALDETKNQEEVFSIHLNLARLNTQINKPDIAQTHIDIIKSGLSKINDNIALRNIYSSLIDFYKLNGEYEEAFYYTKLKEKVIEKIIDESWLEKLFITEKRYQRYVIEKESAEAHQKLITILGITFGLAFFLCFIAALLLRNKRLKFEKELKQSQLVDAENKLLNSENEILKQKLERFSLMKNIHQHLIHDWAGIDRDVQELVEDLGAEQEPELYQRIKKMVADIKYKSNQSLVQYAKDYLRKLSVSTSKISQIPEMQLLIFILIEYEYSKADIFAILGLDESKDEELFDNQLKAIRKNLRQSSIYLKELVDSSENEM
ncbi:M48 family metallopeptidase [Dysgonomonas sp. ZJ709]|uniref:tetratricopeptide repeat protein n=1 Tax=Dysgonomonas sp. ZJ709 TaxID=2709797 RepID=UPI0013ECDB56|nr:hypothetical protein [Dysgonomonas sp. ZJ709]